MSILNKATVCLLELNQGPLVKTKWVKLVFFIEAYRYCKNQNRTFPELQFIKMPNGPAFSGYDVKLEELEAENLIRVQKSAGYNLNINTKIELIDPTILSEIEPDLKAEIENVFHYFKEKLTPWISNFSHTMDIWKKAEMWDPLDFNLLLSDSGIQLQTIQAKNIRDLIDQKIQIP
ncbi:type II toxin-antitoxin system antitoxin SocA domain-containing protein [Leptospira neocaledonica]|nr:type II toxin-antitoxin system antitoxin SocA domain-containing protein [Leptospira neocaledonica]